MSGNKREKEVDEQVKVNIRSLNTKDKIVCTALYNLLKERKEIDNEQQEELKNLFSKFSDMSNPLNKKALELVRGDRQPSDEELANMKDIVTDEEELKQLQETQTTAVPQYWATVLKNIVSIQKYMKSEDYDILKSLINIEIVEEKDNSNVAITLHFSENEYFTNSSLYVKIFVSEDDDETPEKSEGTEINWKEGKNITQKTIKKKQRNKKTGKDRIISKVEEVESFFNIFQTLVIDKDDDDEGDEEDFETMDKLDRTMEIVSVLVEQAVPYSIAYFLNTVEQEGEEDDLAAIEEGEDEDEDDKKVPPRRRKKSSNVDEDKK